MMRRAVAASALLVALAAPPAQAADQPHRDADEIAIVRTLTEVNWERLVDALEQGQPRVRLRDTGTQFPGPTFVGDFDSGAGTLEVRWWLERPAAPVQAIYTLPAASCVPLADIALLWPARKPYFGSVMPGGERTPHDGLQLTLPDAGLHRQALYLADPAQPECLREVIIADTRVRWGMTMDEVESLRRQGAFDLPRKAHR